MKPRHWFFLGLALLHALAGGLIGLSWDVPNHRKTERLLRSELQNPAFYQSLTDDWEAMYQAMGDTTPLVAEQKKIYQPFLQEPVSLPSGTIDSPLMKMFFRSMMIRSRYPDEATTLSCLARMKSVQKSLKPNTFLYGGAYLYPLGAAFKILSLFGALSVRDLQGYLADPDALGRVYTVGRCLSVIAFVFICLLVFGIARGLTGEIQAGLLAVWSISLCPVFLVYSHTMTPHLWSCLWSLLAMFFMTLAWEENLRWSVLMGIGTSVGLALGSHLSQTPLLLFLGLWFLLYRQPWSLRWLRAGITAVIALTTFFAFNPYMGINYVQWVQEIPTPKESWSLFLKLTQIKPFVMDILLPSLGLGLSAGSLAGCLWLLSRRQRPLLWLSLCFLTGLLLYPLWAGGSSAESAQMSRRLLPILAVGIIGAAGFVNDWGKKLAPLYRLGLWIIFLLPSALLSWTHAFSFYQSTLERSPYDRMGITLNQQDPAGHVLGLLNYPQPYLTPHFHFDRWEILLVRPEDLPKLPKQEWPDLLLITFFHKKPSENILSHYKLKIGYYPPPLFPFVPFSWQLSYANTPVELYERL